MGWVKNAALIVLLAAAGMVTYRLLEARLAAGVYRGRLRALSQEHAQLVGMYNQAVRRTAVTELVVKEGKLSVAVRTADGEERVIETPFDPKGEIYVDFAVREGRLWIRRVFDAKTAPAMAVVIDPALETVDWATPGSLYGKAVYRSLEEGRWIVTVSGDGSLALTKREGDEPAVLTTAPAVKDFSAIEKEVERELDRVTVWDLVREMAGGE